tara:strand:- start:61 stop:1122 length:1062 start_codon:yes stop_codon:yes gene_type:complete
MKKLTANALRDLILSEVRGISAKKNMSPFMKAMLNEEYAKVDKGTNIVDLPGKEAYEQLTSGDESAPLIQAMMAATGWASGAIGKAGGVDAIKDWAESIGEEELSNRISKVSDALPASGLAKKDMPALEGEDAPDVKDALSPGGRFNVDIEADYAGNEPSVDAWMKSLSDEDQKKLAAGEEPEVKEEGVIREDKFPAPGTIKGGGKDPVGQALAFLVKGKHDGNQSDDNIDVEVAGSLANSEMIPTQSNILAAKSLLFAFLQGTGNTDLSDMGGAFVTSDGEILDGHHRWSGAYIGTGGSLTHDNVHIVAGKAADLLPALTAIGNAIGREQKESKKSGDDILMERWRSLAGLL